MSQFLRRWYWLCFVPVGLAVLLDSACPPADAEAQEQKKPKLAVLVVFDQMRADYLTRWQEHYDKEGFGRLETDGAWFQNCHYPYSLTLTAAGHTSLVTGCSPNKHGIIANAWYDRKAGDIVGAIEDDKYPLVPASGNKKEYGVAPLRRKMPSVGDALLEQTKGAAKVVSLSIKDRAAALMAALQALICSWFNYYNGMWVTSTYYHGGEVPGWITQLNKTRPADKWFGKDWTKLRPDLDYEKLIGPDDVKFEGTGYKQGKTFPHPTTGGDEKPGKEYYKALELTPYASEMLLDFAKRAIVEEKLGQGKTADLLCLSFSSNDLIGHCWGPDSQEVLDVTLRSDLIIKELLKFLDAKVGKGQYVLVVTADHGVCPLPEVWQAQGHKEGGRLPPEALNAKAADYLDDVFGNHKSYDWIEATASGMIYLNQKTLAKAGVKQDAVEKKLATWLETIPGIQKVYTRTQLIEGPIKDDPLGATVQRSFDPDRSGDLMPVLKPYWQISSPLKASDKKPVVYTTTHGSPHPYDTHVPLFVYGANVKPGIHKEKITPQATASILAAALGIDPPKGAEAPVPAGLWKE